MSTLIDFTSFLSGALLTFIVGMFIYYFRKKEQEYFFYVVVRSQEAMVIERFGKFHRVIGEGLHIIFPLIDRPRVTSWRFAYDPRTGQKGPVTIAYHRIDLRQTLYDFPEQTVITKDHAQIKIDGFLLAKIENPRRIVYSVTNFPSTIENLIEANLRNLIGNMTLVRVLNSREEINKQLQESLLGIAFDWGVKIISVEITNIIPDEIVFKALVNQTVEESHKIAASFKAEAESYTLEQIAKVIGNKNDVSKFLATLKYIEAFKELISKKDGKVVFMPYDSSSLMSSLGMIKELFNDQGTKEP